MGLVFTCSSKEVLKYPWPTGLLSAVCVGPVATGAGPWTGSVLDSFFFASSLAGSFFATFLGSVLGSLPVSLTPVSFLSAGGTAAPALSPLTRYPMISLFPVVNLSFGRLFHWRSCSSETLLFTLLTFSRVSFSPTL